MQKTRQKSSLSPLPSISCMPEAKIYMCNIRVYCIYTYTCFSVGAGLLYIPAVGFKQRETLNKQRYSAVMSSAKTLSCWCAYIQVVLQYSFLVHRVALIFIIYVVMAKIGQAVAVKTDAETPLVYVCVCLKGFNTKGVSPETHREILMELKLIGK